MCFFDAGCRTLSAVAKYATHLFGGVGNHRMAAKWLRAYIHEASFLLADMAGCTTIDNSQFRQPCLLNSALEVALESDGFSAPANQPQIILLIMAPLAEIILGWRDGERNQENDAYYTESANGISE